MLGLIPSRCSAQFTEAFNAFRNMGEKCTVFQNDKDVTDKLKECHWYVMVGNDVIGRAAKEYVYNSGKPFIVLTGSLFDVKGTNKYIRLNVNGFTNNFASMPPSNIDRWDIMQNYHKMDSCFTKMPGDKIVIAMNATTSPAIFEVDIGKWFYDICEELRDITDGQIVVRSHRKKKLPFSPWFDKAKRHYSVTEESDKPGRSTKFGDIRCAITLTTTYSVSALAQGVPVIATHPGNFVYDITRSDISESALDWYPDQDQLRHHYGIISNCEWSIEEIKDGSAMKVLRPLLDNNIITNRCWLGSKFNV
jgi:hypothetical protein|tara:strand:- start:56 stop:973 length:918 start_codon:yes stop_codon:yes gene_type:complete